MVSTDGVVRLEPSAFPALPQPVRTSMSNIGCTVPQSFYAKGRENVVSGQFTQSGAREWAALCSRQGRSEILVFKSSGGEPLARLASVPDQTFVQEVQPGVVGYSRKLAVGRSRVSGRNTIRDAFVEKASTVWSWSARGWQSTGGAD